MAEKKSKPVRKKAPAAKTKKPAVKTAAPKPKKAAPTRPKTPHPKPAHKPTPKALPLPDLDALREMDFDGLDHVFDQLPTPEPGAPEGFCRGEVLLARGLDALPVGLPQMFLKLINSPLSPWRGKRFDGETGTNVWFTENGPAFAGYSIARAHTLDSASEAVVLNYHVDENPQALRPIRGEVKALGPGLWLGRMSYLWRGEPEKLLYFTLER